MNKKNHGLWHGILMLLCCLIPLALIFGLSKQGFGGVLSYGLLLLCPLMHIFMMAGMHGGDKKGSCHGNEETLYEKQ
jgi:hypothetical protein